MSTTQTLAEPRPDAHGEAPRRRRLSVALALAASLIGGTALAANPLAAAPAEAAVKRPAITVTASTSTIVKYKSSPMIRLKATYKGKPVRGVAYFKIDGHTFRKMSFDSRGYAWYRPSNRHSYGNHTLTAVAIPSSSTGLRGIQKSQRITVSKYSSRVLNVASKYVGTKYRYGGGTPAGFDCSGFTSYVYKKAGVKTLSRSSSAQRHQGKKISRSAARPGDLIWSPGHVAIYAGGNTMIDAPRPGKTVQFRQIWQSSPTFLRVSSKAITV
ncbi:NlpC/P60 family protein [Sediminihabitans luteus]|uniref:NlpC/P60 family protein n=1 Tax=Sediminihabitans luteus TaxID=1138585 RepID=A0A2M9D102_9CELL|nr:C40 family peptidase [Sediminihabitans luteus]PJJ77668.1 NlpC/P60 family protein [Sediminihabitans luteus]GII98568.1 hypothetical protein Slu03_09460 [Sediminihabitans luteus]